MPAPGELGACCPHLEEVYEVSTFRDLVDIRGPQSAIDMNELVDLERNQTASNSELTL